MAGVDQTKVWNGEDKNKRSHIIVENRHEPYRLNLRTYVDKNYKITIYYGREWGELFDLEKDPLEHDNLWNNPDYQGFKVELLLKYAWAELSKEPLWMPRVAGA